MQTRPKSTPEDKTREAFFPDEYRQPAGDPGSEELESSFRSISENAGEGIVISPTVEGPFVYANQAASEISGYPISELLQLGPRQLLSTLEPLLESPLPRRREVRLLRKDGGTVPVEIAQSLTRWQGRRAAVILMRDISMRRRIETELNRITSELQKRVEERTSELSATAEELDQKQRELMRHKLELQRANEELVKTNTALSVLARNIDRRKKELEQQIAHRVSSLLLPLVDEIARDGVREKTRAKLDVLAAHLKNLTPGLPRSREVIITLSTMELRIALMIKKDFSSEAIARLLHISPHTVKTHRRNIRKKLALRNSDINLASFLKLKLGRD
jgi:PAS domain S-box-containing protein